jgi:hypothetical protein
MDPNVPVVFPRNDRPATRPNRGNDGVRRHGEAGNVVTANPPVMPNRPGSAAQPANRPDQAGAAANARSRMPSQETVADAISMLNRTHGTENLTAVTGHNTRAVLDLLDRIATRPTSDLESNVRRAARSAQDNPQQLVRNLLAVVAVNPSVVNEMPSVDTLTNTVGMLMGMHDADLTELTALNTQNVIDHLQDIVAPMRGYPLRPIVREAAQQAGDNPEQLVRNLLALVTADSPVRSHRLSSSLQPRLPSPEALTDAIGMLTGARDADLTEVTGRNTLDVINHLYDIEARSQTAPLKPEVREAAQQADNNPAQLVRNLLALVTADVPVLSNRPGSSVQPANAPVVADRPGSSVRADRPGSPVRADRPGPSVRADRPNDTSAMVDARSRIPSGTVLTEAAQIVGAMHGQLANTPGLTDRHLSDAATLMRDIMSLPPSALPPDVRRAAQRGHNDPAGLLQNLLGLVTTNRPGAAPQQSDRPHETGMTRYPSRMPSTTVMTTAVSTLNTMQRAGISGLTRRNLTGVLDHVRDILTSPSELQPSVLRAARQGRDDPAQLVRNLLALVTANPPVLSGRGSSSQPRNRP